MVVEFTPISHPDKIDGNIYAVMHLMNDANSYARFMISFFLFLLNT